MKVRGIDYNRFNEGTSVARFRLGKLRRAQRRMLNARFAEF